MVVLKKWTLHLQLVQFDKQPEVYTPQQLKLFLPKRKWTMQFSPVSRFPHVGQNSENLVPEPLCLGTRLALRTPVWTSLVPRLLHSGTRKLIYTRVFISRSGEPGNEASLDDIKPSCLYEKAKDSEVESSKRLR